MVPRLMLKPGSSLRATSEFERPMTSVLESEKPHARVAERPNLKDQLNRATAEKKAIEKQEKTTKPPVMPEKRISWTNAECFIKPSSMVSLVIPFLDIETLHDPETETDKGEILRKKI
ncbi:hypothetical protein CEP52_009146 [Fusarium oligoseptatum]|uniref:Uncharacterized protein n=1 Tax=Fusarium oligoseptatum TaxID=2604345 RepID=A0A428TEE9_9HYPO|nr:hypothetical protein CEP52_009146 [Fusarium oligoseptatum]